MNGDPFDPSQLIPQVLRTVAASTADTNQRNHVAAMEAAEMAAWDTYAGIWMKGVKLDEGEKPNADQIVSQASDFADAMINRRRKYFGIEVGSVTVPTSRKPET